MREIKFRGRRVDNGEWVDGDLITGVGAKYGKMYILPRVVNLASLKGCHHLDGYEVDPATVGQFTGLLDKNGREIYEGDVIKDCLSQAIMQVVFGYNKNNAYHGWYCKYIGLAVRDTSINGDYDTNQNNNIEVIGNIHENPELIA